MTPSRFPSLFLLHGPPSGCALDALSRSAIASDLFHQFQLEMDTSSIGPWLGLECPRPWLIHQGGNKVITLIVSVNLRRKKHTQFIVARINNFEAVPSASLMPVQTTYILAMQKPTWTDWQFETTVYSFYIILSANYDNQKMFFPTIGCTPNPYFTMISIWYFTLFLYISPLAVTWAVGTKAPDAASPTRCERTWSWSQSPARFGWCLSYAMNSDGKNHQKVNPC